MCSDKSCLSRNCAKCAGQPLSGSGESPTTPTSTNRSTEAAAASTTSAAASTSPSASSVKRVKLTLTYKNRPRHWAVVGVTRASTRSRRILKIRFRRTPAPQPPSSPQRQREEKGYDDVVIKQEPED